MNFNIFNINFFKFLLVSLLDKNILLYYCLLTIFSNFNTFLREKTINLNKLYNYPSNLITLLAINCLFLTLVVAVKITKFFFDPLRTIF